MLKKVYNITLFGFGLKWFTPNLVSCLRIGNEILVVTRIQHNIAWFSDYSRYLLLEPFYPRVLNQQFVKPAF